MATVADLLDTDLPDDAAEDSTSILPLLTGKAEALPNRPMVVHHDYRGNFAIRNGAWKLIGEQLFNLEKDLKETSDVGKEHPEIVKRMTLTLKRYQDRGRSRPLPK